MRGRGPTAAVVEFERMLNERQIITRRVQNAHAFHSRMLTPIVGTFEDEVRNVRLNQPGIPYISNVTGRWITGRDAISPSYWAMHADHTSRFSDALQELWRLKNPILLEAGPGRTLGVLAMQHPGGEMPPTPSLFPRSAPIMKTSLTLNSYCRALAGSGSPALSWGGKAFIPGKNGAEYRCRLTLLSGAITG